MIEQHEIMSMKKPSTTGHDIMLSGMREDPGYLLH